MDDKETSTIVRALGGSTFSGSKLEDVADCFIRYQQSFQLVS